MDCTFRTKEGRFNYRVGAIIINDNKILMVKNSRDPYYYSVGGRVHMNETMEEAVVREVYEETGVHFEIDSLGFIHENFFKLMATGEIFHELSMYYYMKPIDDYSLVCKSLTEDGVEEKLEWIPFEELLSTNIYPRFFRSEKLCPNGTVKHIVDR